MAILHKFSYNIMSMHVHQLLAYPSGCFFTLPGVFPLPFSLLLPVMPNELKKSTLLFRLSITLNMSTWDAVF